MSGYAANGVFCDTSRPAPGNESVSETVKINNAMFRVFNIQFLKYLAECSGKTAAIMTLGIAES
jgi:hypothetical protein